MTSAFGAHQIEEFHALHDWVVVQDMNFRDRVTSTGILLASDDGTGLGIRPRWGKVWAVGPLQQSVQVGQWVCVAHGRWTRGVRVKQGNSDEVMIRKVDPNDILLVSDQEPSDDTMSEAVHIAKKV